MNNLFFKTLNSLFPFVDFLYILQLEEYDLSHFIDWIKSRWWKRNFQKVHQITWTKKAIILLILSLIIYFVEILLLLKLTGNEYLLIVGIIISLLLIPLNVIGAALIFWPLDFIVKQYIINQAKQKLTQLRCSVIAIAGSYGKTTTKYFTYQLLKDKYQTHTPKGNINTTLGLAQDILKNLNSKTEIYIVEFGEYHQGDFKKFFQLIPKQKIIVLTAVGSQHLASFKSQGIIDQEFLEFLQLANTENILVNADNAGVKRILQTMSKKVNSYSSRDIFQYFNQESLPENLKSNHLRQNAAAAAKVGQIFRLEKKYLQEQLGKLDTVARRTKLAVIGGITYIDDSYNINPESAQAALNYLETFTNKRRILVTGGIVDQGEFSAVENTKYGEKISQVVDLVIVANNNFAQFICQGIKKSGKNIQIIISKHPSKTQSILQRVLKVNDVVLMQNQLLDLDWN